jgi:hypothetical protein
VLLLVWLASRAQPAAARAGNNATSPDASSIG